MTSYRLLRDNKETGPYSEEEMIAKGFKPYDLLWAVGRSAGWQYPSEIVPFKKYAPIVEEQPYDRFYKKPPAQPSAASNNSNINSSYQPQPVKDPPLSRHQQPVARPVYNYNVQDLPARHIHVTLPSGNTVNLTSLAAKNETKDTAIPAAANNVTTSDNTYEGNSTAVLPEKQATITTLATASPQAIENKPKAAAKIEQSSLVPAAPAYNKPVAYQPSASDFSWTLLAGAVIGIATLVGLGIMIGLSMNRDKNDAAFNASLLVPKKQLSVPVSARPVPAAAVMPVMVQERTAAQHPSLLPPTKKDQAGHSLVKTSSLPDNTTKEDQKPSTVINTIVNKTKPAPGQDEMVQHTRAIPPAPVNIEKSLTISANDFKSGAFGGISGLKCTLFNGSKFPLESVEVEVDYMQANNKIFKTEKLFFKDIPAGAQSTMDAPASSRGIKVVNRIIKINARESVVNITAKS